MKWNKFFFCDDRFFSDDSSIIGTALFCKIEWDSSNAQEPWRQGQLDYVEVGLPINA